MRAVFSLLVYGAFAALLSGAAPAEEHAARRDRIQLVVDTSEAEAVLAALDERKTGEAPAAAAWRRIFSSEPR